MEIAEIIDEKSLERWLKDRPREDGIALGLRISKRVLPLWAKRRQPELSQQENFILLGLFRSLQGLGAAIEVESILLDLSVIGAESSLMVDERDAEPRAVVCAVRTALQTALDDESQRAVDAFDYSVRASGIDTEDLLMWQVRSDAGLLVEEGDILAKPLWSETPPDWFTSADREGRAIWAKEPKVWEFWVRWWDGVIAGKPLPWDLQEKVALIPDEDWQKGPSHIAGVIRGIEAGFVGPKLSGDSEPNFEAKLGAVRLQIDGLRLIVEAEWNKVCARNHVPESEQDQHEKRKELLSKLRDLISELEKTANGTSDAPAGKELVVVGEQLPAVIEAAEELAETTKAMHPSADIMSVAASMKVLTESGMPGTIASGAVAVEWVSRKLSSFFTRSKKTKKK
jgi:hypothetical protein